MILFHQILPTVAVFSLIAFPVAFADTTNYNPTGEGCVDPKGFLTCYQTQINKASSCSGLCNSTDAAGTAALKQCELGCDGQWHAGNIACWIQSCWNQVYSCEYQYTVIQYFSDMDITQNSNVPFYPPPADASAGACSCNIGYVYGNITYINTNNVCEGMDQGLTDCECCEFSFTDSNILNACPNTNLTLFNFASSLAQTQQLIGKSTDNCAILNSGDTCVTQYGFPFYGTIYNPLSLPAGEPGDQPFSDLPGNPFTEIAKVITFVLPAFAYTSVITPEPFVNGAGANTGSAQASVSTTVAGSGNKITTTTTNTNTGTATAATTTSTKSGPGAKNMASPLAWAIFLVSFMIF